MAKFRMRTTTDIRRTLQRVANMVLEGELEAKQANAIICACNSVLSAIRTDEQGAKLKELETLLMEMEKRQEANKEI